MLAPGEGSRTATEPSPSRTLRLLSHGNNASNKKKLQGQSLFKADVERATGKVQPCKSQQQVLTHSLHRIHHFPSDSPVRFMVYSEAGATFISLHTNNTVGLYKADGCKQSSSAHLPFLGLTPTKVSGCLVGWGPGPVFTLLDAELKPVETAHDALDIRVCRAAERSTELVTAGVGNVCVWSVRLMRCRVKVQKGLEHSAFTHMALAPPRSDRPHRAFAVCGHAVTEVDLHSGKLMAHKKHLCWSDITAVEYCSELDSLVIASGASIRAWGPDWGLRLAFRRHHGVVSSLFYCSELHVLLSASLDGAICWWNVEKGDEVTRVHTEQENPPLCVGGTSQGDTFFSFSQRGVDLWSIKKLYSLHCKIKQEEEDEEAPLRQILVPPFPAPYPTRVLCVSGSSHIKLVSAQTGAVVTSFKAQQRVLCADYCLHKEILLVLTEAGDVLQASTLTNPITLMQEWQGRGQGPWQNGERVQRVDAHRLPVPGLACCLALYSSVADPQGAFENWRSLQQSRGCGRCDQAAPDDAKNRFLIILGQSGGCVSVLKLGDGTVLYRTPAHSGQRVTTLQVHHEKGLLISAGEDMTVVVWKVKPFLEECLSQHLSFHCGQPQVYAAALGPQLVLTHNSGTWSLVHFDLVSQSQTGRTLTEGHQDHFTGLCVCPDLEVFVSSSLDGTVCIWDKDNHLLRMFQLNVTPECLAFGGFGGEVFLGIGGDLYRINCAQFLPHKYQQMLLYTCYEEPPADLPIITSKAEDSKRKTDDSSLTEDLSRQKECGTVAAVNSDLSSLLQDTVKSKRGKPPSTKQTRKEAFGHYMKQMYGLCLDIQVDADVIHELSFNELRHLPAPDKETRPECETIDLKEEKEQNNKRVSLTSLKSKTLMDVKERPVKKGSQQKPVVAEKEEEKPPEVTEVPKEQPELPKTPRFIRIPTAPPTREPSPALPTFLQPFADSAWFRALYPDKKSIRTILTPDDFSLQLLACLETGSASSKVEVLAALQALHSQELLKAPDKLYQGLMELVPTFARPHMSPLDQNVMVETLNLLLSLKSAQTDLMKKLLTLLAYKNLGLRETLLHMLTALGVDEAEQWLWPELENWSSELQDQADTWMNLHDRADSWLELWISKYKEYNRFMYLRSAASWRPLTFSAVDVLNYFCFVQNEEYRKLRNAGPAFNNTVLPPLHDCVSQPILRLGETYSMARIHRPPGIILPPLRNRPFLMHFPNFLSLPMTRVTLCPFHVYSDKDWIKDSTRRYFIPQQSFVEYYR